MPTITQRTIVMAINTPGGIVYEWRDARAKEMVARGRATSPKGNPLDYNHRAAKPGDYLKSWRWERGRPSETVLRAIIRNRSQHAIFVEKGRKRSFLYQRFSWKNWHGARQAGQWSGAGAIRYIGQKPKGIPANVLAAWQMMTPEELAKLNPKLHTPWGGYKTAARRGRNTLKNAINYVMVPWGFTRL